MPYNPRILGRSDGITTSSARYQISLSVPRQVGGMVALRKRETGRIARIRRIWITKHRDGTGAGLPLRIQWATNLTNGTLIPSGNIPKLDTSYPNATLDVLVAPPQILFEFVATSVITFLGTNPTDAANLGGPLQVMSLLDHPDCLVINRADRSILMDSASLDDNDIWGITIEWEEEL
jgi:hypothetical protein